MLDLQDLGVLKLEYCYPVSVCCSHSVTPLIFCSEVKVAAGGNIGLENGLVVLGGEEDL